MLNNMDPNYEMNPQVIGGLVRMMRKKDYPKQKDFAEACGLSASCVSAVENGQELPTLSTLSVICKTLDYRIPDFFSMVAFYARHNDLMM